MLRIQIKYLYLSNEVCTCSPQRNRKIGMQDLRVFEDKYRKNDCCSKKKIHLLILDISERKYSNGRAISKMWLLDLVQKQNFES
ncbi:hypothetical protein CR513_46593, partial [Mucuna pruriens]